jgi:hypothetical protein
MTKLILLIATLLFLSGCDGKELNTNSIKTVEYYLKHEVERKTKIKECKPLLLTPEYTTDCENAQSAAEKLFKEKQVNGKTW